MKHLSLLLTVLGMGAMPLAAAALDYGPNRPLLAAENGAPQLPVAPTRDAPTSTLPKPDVAEIDRVDGSDAARSMPRTAPKAAPPATVRSNRGPSASNPPRGTMAEPATTPGPASWQSLLPGSIQ